MRRTPFRRKETWKGLSRGSGLKRGTAQLRRTRIKPVSEKRKKENDERRQIPLLDYCEAKRAGAPGECYGALHLHEVLPRARGGSITDPSNTRTVCDEHNRLISQDADVMAWAYENDFLRHAWDDKEAAA